jgi:hypothetical protein
MSPSFKFLTNHGLALLCIAANPEVRIRDIAVDLNITERAAQRIVGELVDAHYLERNRVGRRNRYALPAGVPTSPSIRRVMALSSLLEGLSHRVLGEAG